jgi:YegS/Rv2252/BmrU family lipid kinase
MAAAAPNPESGFDKTVLITNPNSRSGDQAIPDVLQRLHALGPLHAYEVDGSDSALRAINELGGHSTRVVLGGGDGTLAGLLDAVLDTGSTLGVLPMGTANDFARSLQLPLDVMEAVEIIAQGHTRHVDVGVANGKTFLNAVGIGLGPRLTREMDEESKSRLGLFAYSKALMKVLQGSDAFRVRITVDGETHSLHSLQVSIGNGIHYGGGMTISDTARIDDGQLSVLCLRRQPNWELIKKALALRVGDFQDVDDILLLSGKRVEIETARPMDATADGEIVTKTPIQCESQPKALRVFCRPVDTGSGAV